MRPGAAVVACGSLLLWGSVCVRQAAMLHNAVVLGEVVKHWQRPFKAVLLPLLRMLCSWAGTSQLFSTTCLIMHLACCCARIGMRETKIIAKIENMEGLVNYCEIMEHCDVMLLSRGSMGNCVDPEKMFLAQKMLLRVRAAMPVQIGSNSKTYLFAKADA